MVVAGVLVFVEKPWALTHAQLWAEDGSVHLVDNEAFGAKAFFLPYRGYLHLLPRMIAWLASRTVDVAYWPTFYNAAAFAVALIVFARLASARLDLPDKPWLILAFVLAVSTGEVFLNITNLHWLTAFLILAQVLIAAPRTRLEGIIDFLILPIVGLTGPFIAVFLPLFVWRWWRERTVYSLAVLGVAGVCAGTQAFLVVTTGPHFFVQSEHINFALLFAVVGSRFAVWPLLGPTVALALPLWALSGLGALILLPVVVLSLRKDAYRLLRTQILIAFGLIAAVGVYRIRPDSWMQANIELGDSYFFIPRILGLWLLIWLMDARPRVVAWIARILCVGGVLLNLGDLIQPTPVDFGWASLCQPIRSGTPANIPTLPEDWILQYPGRPIHVEPTSGWYALESGSRGAWCWTSGEATLHVVAKTASNVEVLVTLKGIGPQRVTVTRSGRLVWEGKVDQQFRQVSLPVGEIASGSADLVFSSDTPGVPESSMAGARTLAFAAYNWRTKP